MIPIVFINCREHPFLAAIMSLDKTYETRSRNTLRALVGQRVLLAETGTGRPVVRCSAIIRCAVPVTDRKTWQAMRKAHRVPRGSRYDWKKDTRRKWLYMLDGITYCVPFQPAEGVRHGRTWMEYDDGKEA